MAESLIPIEFMGFYFMMPNAKKELKKPDFFIFLRFRGVKRVFVTEE